MNESVHAAEVDECTEVDDRRHDARGDLSRLQVREELARCSFWVSSSQARRDSTTLLRFLSSSMILASRSATDVRLQVADTTQLDERGGKEAAQADVDDQATLDDLDNRAAYNAVGFFDLLDRAPCALVLRTLFRKDEAAFFVLFLENERFDVVAERDDLDAGRRRCGWRAHATGMTPSDLKPMSRRTSSLSTFTTSPVDDVAVVELDDRRAMASSREAPDRSSSVTVRGV